MRALGRVPILVERLIRRDDRNGADEAAVLHLRLASRRVAQVRFQRCATRGQGLRRENASLGS